MTPDTTPNANAAHQLLRALYLHALAPSAATQDAVRAAGAALDTETARALNAPRDAPNEAATLNAEQILISAVGDDDAQWGWQVWDDVGELSAEGVVPSLAVALAQVAGVVKDTPRSPAPVDSIVAEVRADLLARSERGIAEYGCTLDRKDLGLREWMEHAYHEGLDRDLYLKRAMRELDRQPAWSARDTAAFLALQAERDQLQAKVDAMATDAPVEPPHAAAPVLAPLTPEPTEAVLGRAVEALGASPLPYSVMQPGWTPPPGVLKAHSGEALAWDGQQLPVWVEFEPGVRHPYGDAAFHVAAHVTPDGKARLFPSKAAANVWLVANGTVPV